MQIHIVCIKKICWSYLNRILHFVCIFQCHGYTKFSKLFLSISTIFLIGCLKLPEGVLFLILKKQWYQCHVNHLICVLLECLILHVAATCSPTESSSPETKHPVRPQLNSCALASPVALPTACSHSSLRKVTAPLRYSLSSVPRLLCSSSSVPNFWWLTIYTYFHNSLFP
jgi:hypothetical protein